MFHKLSKFIVVFMLLIVITFSGNIGCSSNSQVTDIDLNPNFNPDILYIKACAVTIRSNMPQFEITKEAMDNSYRTFKDRNIILGHDAGDPNVVVGRIIKVSKRHDKELSCDYIEVVAKIFDKEAIRKIKTGKYYYMSVGLRGVTGTVNPFTQKTIIKKFIGVEVSFVAVPADKYAKVLEYSHNKEDMLREKSNEKKDK